MKRVFLIGFALAALCLVLCIQYPQIRAVADIILVVGTLVGCLIVAVGFPILCISADNDYRDMGGQLLVDNFANWDADGDGWVSENDIPKDLPGRESVISFMYTDGLIRRPIVWMERPATGYGSVVETVSDPMRSISMSQIRSKFLPQTVAC